jgi:hypothetical protein
VLPGLLPLLSQKLLRHQVNRESVCSFDFPSLEDQFLKFACLYFLFLSKTQMRLDTQTLAVTQGPLCLLAALKSKPCSFHFWPLEAAHLHTLALLRFLAAHTLLETLEVGQTHLFPLQHSLRPSELLMSGSLPCKLQNENTANKKGHRLLSAHLLLT